MKKIILGVLVMFSICCETPQLEYYVPQEITYVGHQEEVRREINLDRIEHGLPILIPEKKLTEIAKDYAIILDSTGIYNHRFFIDRWIESGAKYFGEVLAINYITAASEMSAFQSSTSHINILRNPKYKYIGIYKVNGCLVVELATYYNN